MTLAALISDLTFKTEEVVEYEELDEENPLKIPYAHEVSMTGHTKTVTALGLDPAGSRLLSGAHDFRISFWDFAAMDRSFKSFRSIEPHPSGNYLVSPCPAIYTIAKLTSLVCLDTYN